MMNKEQRRLRIKVRVRGKISGTSECPRLSVFRSNKQIYAQIIDDQSGRTLVSASSLKISSEGTKKEIAAMVGQEVARAAVAAGIERVVFDRNGYLYHGRVRELAEAARNNGLKF